MKRKINSPKDLNNLRNNVKKEIELRNGPKEIQITVHMGTCGIAAGAREIVTRLTAEILNAKVNNVTIHQSGCIGLCDREPMFTISDKHGNRFVYGNLDTNKVHEIVQKHILTGTPVSEYLINT